MAEPFHTLGTRTTLDSIAEQRMKVDAGVVSKRKKKRKILKNLIRKV